MEEKKSDFFNKINKHALKRAFWELRSSERCKVKREKLCEGSEGVVQERFLWFFQNAVTDLRQEKCAVVAFYCWCNDSGKLNWFHFISLQTLGNHNLLHHEKAEKKTWRLPLRFTISTQFLYKHTPTVRAWCHLYAQLNYSILSLFRLMLIVERGGSWFAAVHV